MLGLIDSIEIIKKQMTSIKFQINHNILNIKIQISFGHLKIKKLDIICYLRIAIWFFKYTVPNFLY